MLPILSPVEEPGVGGRSPILSVCGREGQRPRRGGVIQGPIAATCPSQGRSLWAWLWQHKDGTFTPPFHTHWGWEADPPLQAPRLAWGWEALHWHSASENLILRKNVWEWEIETGTDMQTEGDIYRSRTDQVCVSATGPQSSLVKWDPSSLRTVVFHKHPHLFRITWRLHSLYMTYFSFSQWGLTLLSRYWIFLWTLVDPE